ncbi:PAS domain S-box protein [Desulfococcaceae bacterium HSG8]|nr:PAS domain S-box protein [Desulfococcaceae bacterium HSG8]
MKLKRMADLEAEMRDEEKNKEQLIEELKELRQRLVELELEEYRVAFEQAKDAILWIDTDRGMIVNCNKAAEMLLEKKREEIVGRLQLTLHPPEKAEYYVRIFKIQTDRKYSFAYEEKYGFAYEGEIITKSKRIVPVYITASVASMGDKKIIQQTFHKITKYKHLENVLKKSIEFTERLNDAIPYIIFCKDIDGIYEVCNNAFSEFAGLPKSKILGRTDSEIFSKELSEEFREKDKEVLKLLKAKSTGKWVTYPDGRKILLDIFRTIYYGPDDKILGTIGIARDITDIRRKEEAIREADIANRKHLGEAFKKATKNLMVAQQQLNQKNVKLNETLKKIEEANRKIMDSIRYAKVIQTSLLPNLDGTNIYMPDSFVIWMPRDVVGGDIFFKDAFTQADGSKAFVLAVVDCTGHGVPGAFMTMIASSGLRRIIKDEKCYNPAKILKKLNFIVKTSLRQDRKETLSDDGLDAAICLISDIKGSEEKNLTFSGARLPLYYVQNGKIMIIKGDRQSIGYKRSDLNFDFTNRKIRINNSMSFYMATDGYLDQIGGEKNHRFGTRRFKTLIEECAPLPFIEQREVFIHIFNEYKGKNERRDDVTLIGFAFKN